MKRSAHMYLGEDRIVLQPFDSTSEYSGFAGALIHSLSHSASMAEILVELDKTLADCKLIPPPADVKTLVRPLLAAAGEKTWHAVCRSFATISVYEDGAELVFHALKPVYGAFSGTGKYQRCILSDRAQMTSAFRAAAAVAMEEQHLNNPPPLV